MKSSPTYGAVSTLNPSNPDHFASEQPTVNLWFPLTAESTNV